MLRGPSRQIIGLKPSGQDDPEGQRASTILAAYFDAEEMRAFRQRIWRWQAVVALVAWLVEVTTPLLTVNGLVSTWLALLAAAIVAAVAEWRAANILRALIESNGARRVEAGPS